MISKKGIMYLWTATGSPQTNDSERGITMKKIGAITVGQSPRVDLIPEIQPILGDSVELWTDFQRKRSQSLFRVPVKMSLCPDSRTEPQRHSENPTFFPACSFALTISNSRVFP